MSPKCEGVPRDGPQTQSLFSLPHAPHHPRPPGRHELGLIGAPSPFQPQIDMSGAEHQHEHKGRFDYDPFYSLETG